MLAADRASQIQMADLGVLFLYEWPGWPVRMYPAYAYSARTARLVPFVI